MPKVAVVSAFVPLNVRHLTADAYHELGQRMLDATKGRYRFFDNFPLEECWLSKENPPLVPAAPTPSDRYATDADYVRSNIVQHSRTQWALKAWREDPTIDTIIWLDLGILKQGAHTGKPVTEDDVSQFVDAVAATHLDCIPFPGIEGQQPINVHGNNWRFCGSTHIWPTQLLTLIDQAYVRETRRFIREHKCTPLDLAIWPAVELHSGLPFHWYKAEYDRTQLTAFQTEFPTCAI
jgi:hypothetical protein